MAELNLRDLRAYLIDLKVLIEKSRQGKEITFNSTAIETIDQAIDIVNFTLQKEEAPSDVGKGLHTELDWMSLTRKDLSDKERELLFRAANRLEFLEIQKERRRGRPY